MSDQKKKKKEAATDAITNVLLHKIIAYYIIYQRLMVKSDKVE